MTELYDPSLIQLIGTAVALVAAIIGIPKAMQAWEQRKINKFNVMLKNSEEFQNLKREVKDYSDRTTKAEGDIRFIMDKLDIFIRDQKTWQHDLYELLKENRNDTKEINNWLRDHFYSDASRRLTSKKSWPFKRKD